jgi:hypothetical protein
VFYVKKWTLPVFLLLLYSLPYAFLAMYGDHALGTMLLYAPLAIALSLLCLTAIRKDLPWVVVPGNLGSFLSSRAFLLRYQGEGWDVYFKPFSPAGFLLLISAIALGAQLVWLFSEQKKKAAFSKKERKSP